MAFVDRKKQPHLWRTENPHPTAEQVVVAALKDHAAGIAVDFASNVIAKAFKKFGLSVPAPVVADVVGSVVDAAAGTSTVKPRASRSRSRK